MSALAFIDIETTGLDPDRHQIWEVAAIVDGVEYEWMLPVDLSTADPRALAVGRFHERHPQGFDSNLETPEWWYPGRQQPRFVREFARLTRGRHLVGAVVSFDEERLRRLLQRRGACPEWHYHLIDVEALAIGYVEGAQLTGTTLELPWNSKDLSRLVGVDPDEYDAHTALGDARWAKAIYENIVRS